MAAALPDYRYGQVTGQFPDLTVVSERSETPMVCCGYCSAHMASRTAVVGLSDVMQNEAHRIRARGGRPHPAGSHAQELRDGAQLAVGVQLLSIAVDDIPGRLRAGFAVTVGLAYAKLPGYLRVQANDFGHAACLYGWQDDGGGRAGYFDPLWVQGARGAWASWADVRGSLWPDGNHSTTTARLVAMAGDYIIYDDEVQSLRTGTVAAGTTFYNDWTLESKRGVVGGAPIVCQVMGYRAEALAVQVTTGQGWNDGASRPTLVFVPKARVSNIVHGTPPGGSGSASAEQLLAAKQAGYDLAMSPFPPRPTKP